MLHRKEKKFFSSSDNSSGSFNQFRFKKAIDKKRLEKPFNSQEKNKKRIDKTNKKETKVSFFIKTFLSSLIGIISLIYLVKIIFDLFKDKYLELGTFFLFSGFLLMSLFVTLFSIKRIFYKKKEALKFFWKTLNISIVFIFTSVIITTIENTTSYLNKIKPEDLVSIEIKPKSINLRTTKYTKRIYINAQKYSSFLFKVKNVYQFDYTDFVNSSNENDILNIKITKKDLNRKLTKNEELTFWDKHFKYDEILIYELSKNNNVLLKLIQNQTSTSEIIRLILLFIFNSILATCSIILILNVFNIKKASFYLNPLKTKTF